MGTRTGNYAPRAARDLAGRVFGRLTVLAYAGSRPCPRSPRGKSGRREALWRCRCECGREVVVLRGNLRSGNTRSCGCGWRKHGLDGTPEHSAWKRVRSRNGNVCSRWDDFRNFLADVGPRPSPGHRLTRRDAHGDWGPGNCHWVPANEVGRNRRDNVRLACRGETRCLAEWARAVGLSYGGLRGRLRKGWSAEEAILTPRLRARPKPRFAPAPRPGR